MLKPIGTSNHLLKKIAFTPDMAGLIESLMFEKQTSKKPDIDKIIYYQRTKKNPQNYQNV